MKISDSKDLVCSIYTIYIIGVAVYLLVNTQSAYAQSYDVKSHPQYSQTASQYPQIQPLSTQITWKDMRDSQVTKQDKDYSCGASSLSTILTYFYQTPTTEIQILEDIGKNKDKDEIMASFQDLANVSQEYGFIGKGIATNYNSLKKITIPVIVYLNHKRSDHFSVVRAIDEHNVYLSDSSWGNRTLTRKQFEHMWHTRNDDNLQGKVLLILPTNAQQKQLTNKEFVKIEKTQKLLKEILREIPELLHEYK